MSRLLFCFIHTTICATGFTGNQKFKCSVNSPLSIQCVPIGAPALTCTLKDFENAKNENYYFLHPEHFLPSLTDKNE